MQRVETETEIGLVELVAHNVRRLRQQMGISIRVVAERGGMAPQAWQRIETGALNLHMDTVAKLCLGLGVDAEVLFRPAPQKRTPLKQRARSKPNGRPRRQGRASSVTGLPTTFSVSGAR